MNVSRSSQDVAHSSMRCDTCLLSSSLSFLWSDTTTSWARPPRSASSAPRAGRPPQRRALATSTRYSKSLVAKETMLTTLRPRTRVCSTMCTQHDVALGPPLLCLDEMVASSHAEHLLTRLKTHLLDEIAGTLRHSQRDLSHATQRSVHTCEQHPPLFSNRTL
jgi:hypothetical protein